MRWIVERLAVDLPFAAYNGGNIVAPRTWEVLGAHKLPRDAVDTALAGLAREWHRRVEVFIGDVWYLTNPKAAYLALETRTVGYEGVLVRSFDEVDLDAVDKIVGSTVDEPLLARVETGLQATLEGRALAARSQITTTSTSRARSPTASAVRNWRGPRACRSGAWPCSATCPTTS